MNRVSAVAIGLAALAVALAAAADFDSALWEFRSRVISGSIAASDFVILELPAEFFAHLKADLSDLRVVSQEGEVPYVAAVEREAEGVSRLATRIFNLSSRRGESTTFIVDLGASGVFHNSITIETSSENFRRIVEIQGSNDQASWRTLNPRGQIFDLTIRDIKPVKARDTSIAYPDATFRYLRVEIFDQGEPPLAISGVSAIRRIATAAREITYQPTMEIRENDAERTTEVVLDLGINGIPHRRGRIATPSANFSRAVAVFDSDDRENWRLLTNAYLFVIDTPRFSGANLEFAYPESNRRYLRLSIQNRDDRPIAVSGATLTGVMRSILFRFDSSKEYFVYLGNAEARRPGYDIERISPYVDAGTLNRVRAGSVEKNPSFTPVEPPKPPLTERVPYFLPAALGVLVAVLAFLLLRLVTKAKALPPSPPPSSVA
ncbi:MAG: hypothetical protein A3B37_00050 [Candidatus Sungbacteria bacterium RIFCSPLOWO2_01_FULL_59_16]|uniref:F5/8 type C domain-containing protein n=1 Tax=Candidatus Sungbacteria bacterium RIFCSPLOWO2_01_FULL_59_16 TaxID=1802280 RepID=A0A1G2LA18_9BACT|nr:MAG: hypothetical protein A3B37_00050 [Candidatus Sungbacteria bacterium RIFCSPLOWO2_01_FULL_59_16]